MHKRSHLRVTMQVMGTALDFVREVGSSKPQKDNFTR